MKVTDILINSQDEFSQILLKKDLHNDIALDRCFVDITVTPDNFTDFLYRRLWETIYLRRDMSCWSSINCPDSVNLKISFVEAINFIKSVTPPIYQSRVHELYYDPDNIKKSLELFLKDDAESVIKQNISVFKKGIGFQKFETSSKYDMDRINYLRKKTDSSIIIDVEICSDFRSVLNGDTSNSYIDLQGVISYYNRLDLCNILTQLQNELPYMYILNVFSDDMNGNFIEFYIDKKISYDFSTDFPCITDLIQQTYRNK